MLFSRLCAVVTSLATTNACTGCCVCPPIASANWFVSLAPTILNDGGAGALPLPADMLGVATVPPPVGSVFLIVAMFLAATAPAKAAWTIG